MIPTCNPNAIAICMATFNGAAYLQQQLDSILRQTCTNWILFIRDDHSQDETPQILHRFHQQHPDKVCLIEDSTLSGGSAKDNFAAIVRWVVKHDHFRYFMFADQDDVWLNTKVERSLAALQRLEQQHPGPALVHTDLCVVDQALEVLADSYFQYRSINPSRTDLKHLLVQNVATGCTMIWNRALNDLVNWDHPDIILHDWWIALTASAFGTIACIKEAHILYRQHENNTVGAMRTNTLGFVILRLKQHVYVKQLLRRCVRQASAFLSLHRQRLNNEQLRILSCFSTLHTHRKPVRWFIIIKEGFLKHGLLQIIGELLFI